ncbi:MAG: transposase, partial [Patescibacteria group bacterium]|nr:transposase [Patescibacteria group bacterium]
MRKNKFANNEYYHVYNRGVDKREIFCCEKDYLRFLVSMREFNDIETTGGFYRKYLRNKNEKDNLNRGLASKLEAKPLFKLSFFTKIICYCLNPNHYHFILKQLTENGIAKFMQKLGTSYTMYFNIKYDRSGSLFQGPFKSKHIDTNEYLLWLSGYVNGNAEIHKIAKAENYKWCSYQDYLNKRNGTLCNKKIILDQFKNMEEYQKYVKMVIEESNKRKDLKKYF